jgi:YbgC/YbaW family acyl-CoA thioester hydrolase
MEVRVRFRDTDSTGRIFFSKYLEFFDDSIIEFFRERNVTVDLLGHVIFDNKKSKGVFVIGECYCRFLSETSFDDLLEVSTEVREIKKRSKKIVFHTICYNKTKAMVSAEGNITFIYINPKTKRAIPIPQKTIMKLQKRG